MTRGEMTDRIQAWLGLQSMDDYDEVSLIHDLIYRGTIDLLARTRCTVRCYHLQYFAGIDTYTLDHNIMSLVDVEDGHSRRLRRDQSGFDSSAIGTVVYPAGTVPLTCGLGFTLVRSDVLQVKPAPSNDGEFDVWAVPLPNKMTDDDMSPGDEGCGAIPEEFQDAIELYVRWQGADYDNSAAAQQGERYRIQYEGQDGRGGRISQIKMLVNKRGTARAPARRVRMQRTNCRGAWVG